MEQIEITDLNRRAVLRTLRYQRGVLRSLRERVVANQMGNKLSQLSISESIDHLDAVMKMVDKAIKTLATKKSRADIKFELPKSILEQSM